MKALRFFAAVFFTAVSSAHALDPYRVDDQQQRNRRDSQDLSRPTTTTLKGADIKEHRDKVNAVKAQIFQKGSLPTGATFRAVAGAEGAPSARYVAEARFDELTPQVKEGVARQMGETPRGDQRVAVQVDVGPDAVSVATARLGGAIPTAAQPASGNAEPIVQAPADVPTTIVPRAPVVAAPQVPSVVIPAARPARVSQNQPAPPPASHLRAAPRAEPVSSKAERAPPVVPSTIRSVTAALAGPTAVIPAVGAPAADAAALIPTPSGRDLTVRTTNVSDQRLRVEVSGRSGDLPISLASRIAANLGVTALPSRPDTPVTVVLAIDADESVRIVELRKDVAPAANQSAQPAPASNSKNAAAVPAAPSALAVPAAPPAPVAPSGDRRVATESPVASVAAARIIATWSEIDPATVRAQAIPETRVTTMAVPTGSGREIRVEAVTTDRREAATAVRAEGRLSDFSPDARQQVTKNLKDFNSAGLVTPESQVVIEARQDNANAPPVVTAVAVRLPDAPNGGPVLLWREAEAPTAPAENGAPAAPVRAAGAPAGPAPARPGVAAPARVAGLAPAIDALAAEGYAIPKSGYEIKQADAKGGIKIDPNAAGKADIPVDWRAGPTGDYGFESVGKPVDFADAIREQIYAKLRDAIENGSTWAAEALKGQRQARVSFDVDPANAQNAKVRVKDVGPTLRDASNDAAQDMGLVEGDFFVVNVGAQSLIVLERGKTASLRVGEGRMKLTSPDGDAKVFVIPSKTKKDTSAVMMLSRDSLKANRAAIIKAGGPKAASAIKAALDGNSQAPEFIVKVDPAGDESVSIRAMSGGTDVKPIERPKKPEDLP